MKTRIFFATYTAANIGLVFYGLLVLIKPEILLEPFTANIYQFPIEATGAVTHISALYRLLGYLNIIPGLLGLSFLYCYWTTGQDWFLKLVVASTSLTYIGPIVFDNTVGAIGFFEILEHVHFILVVILGLSVLNQRPSVSEMINRTGATRLGVWTIKHLVAPLQRWIYRATRGRFLSNFGEDRNVLLLTTKGRRTGLDRTIPVFYLQDGDSVVICNVNPEHERTNPWVLNLRSDPLTNVQIGQSIAQYRSREATIGEIDRLWPRLTSLWPAFQDHFEFGGSRSIFILDRA